MKKKVGILVLATALVFGGTSLQVLANGKGNGNAKASEKFEQLTDGRNGNGIETGTVMGLSVNITNLFVGEELNFSVEGVSIDGPIDTLEWSIVDEDGATYNFGEKYKLAAGDYKFTVTASTFFKNGAKAGKIHSTTAPEIIEVTVKELVEELVEVTSYELTKWNYTSRTPNGYDLNATATFTFSDGTTAEVTRGFNNVQLTQSLSFTAKHENGTEFTKSLTPPAYETSKN